MKIKDWIKDNRSVFSDTDLRFLMKEQLGKESSLVLAEDVDLTSRETERLNEAKQMYSQGKPLAYILGKEEFFGYELEVTQDVLIPRKETELVVEKAIDIITSHNINTVLDLCCGFSKALSLAFFD